MAALTVTAEEAGLAFAILVGFLRSERLTARVAAVEHELVRADKAVATGAAGLTEEVLCAALIVRREVGRISDVIHAAVISLALPKILEEGEVIVNRPSLGLGTIGRDLSTWKRTGEWRSSRLPYGPAGAWRASGQ